MTFLDRKSLEAIGFCDLGKNVKVSDKAVIYDANKISIGDNTRIDDFCVISGRVSLGRNVHVAVFSNVAGGSLGIKFEDFSGLAYSVNVFTQSADYSGAALTNPTVPKEFVNDSSAAVVIGRHVIVGAGSIIFPGVILAEGCSIGAMSMVTTSTEPWGVYVGIPAKRLKDRTRELLQLERNYLAQEDLG